MFLTMKNNKKVILNSKYIDGEGENLLYVMLTTNKGFRMSFCRRSFSQVRRPSNRVSHCWKCIGTA